MKAEWGWKFPSDTPQQVVVALPQDMNKNKKVMPYMASLRSDIEARGSIAFDRSLTFDDTKVFNDNISLVISQLAMFAITKVVVSTVDEAIDSAAIRDAVPGEPAFHLSRST